ncbi:hypothetical protein [Mesobacillus subterraneus]|uniref:Uncharacterized protein n=1 Tax=Mesobacillus subterraneus TaxID=285983 RepID=A0A3R9EZV0_9BACI|nr:hypothetical protein [Mesobacillus subterraneus]RSD25887.1 hypothetical protein EJA10_15995 [Mesobacillus subterraneus]
MQNLKNRNVVLAIFVIVVLVIATIYMLQPKEPFPIKSISTSDAINMLEKSGEDIVLITSVNEKNWYLTYKDNMKGQQKFIDKMESLGWKFDNQDGSGFFFSNQTEKRIGGCKIWNSKYLVCHD